MSEAVSGRVLVVDSDYDTLGALSRALRARGHHVVLAADGRAGLQRAVEVSPDVVLVDYNLAILDVRTFLEVLRDNPRTGGSHAFLMGNGDASRFEGVDARAEPLLKPFNAEEVASRVDEVLRSRLGPRREPELRGDLQQVALFDLLQVFAANRRTGRLRVEGPVASGEVWVREGRIVDASYGGTVGEKALYRILAVLRADFVFTPRVEADLVRIDRPTDHLLMEAARQADEIARVREHLPSLDALVSRGSPALQTSPLEEWVLERLDEPRAIEELLDLASTSDLAVLQAVAALLDRGELLVFDPRGQRVRLCDDEEAVSLRAAVARLRRPGLAGPVRLAVLTEAFLDVTRFGRALASVDEFVAEAQAPLEVSGGAFGSLGVLRIEGTDIELFVLPLELSLRPLWGPFLASARMALLLSDGPPDPELAELLRAHEIFVATAPTGWERPQGAADAIRTALAHATPKTPAPT